MLVFLLNHARIQIQLMGLDVVRQQTVSHTVILEGRARTCEVDWLKAGNHAAHTRHPGYPSCSFPPDAEAPGTISCPLSPSLRATPYFLDKVHGPKQPGFRTSAPPPQGAMRHGVHTHPHRNSQKTKKCSKQPDSSKWRSGYSGLLHFLALHLKLAFWTLSECFGRVRADWLAGGRFTLGETNRLQSHKVL